MSLTLSGSRAVAWPQGSQWISCADLAALYRRLQIAEATVAAQDRMITSLEDDIRKAREAEANQQDRFLAAVGSLR